MNLDYYNKQKDLEVNQVKGFISILTNEASLAIDVAHVAKSMDIMNLHEYKNYPELLDAMMTGASRISFNDLSSEDRLYLSRAVMRYGNNDSFCADGTHINIHGEVEVGERSLECFGDRILENFYEDQ